MLFYVLRGGQVFFCILELFVVNNIVSGVWGKKVKAV